MSAYTRPTVLALIAACALLVVAAPAQGHHAQRLMVKKINKVRKASGLPGLRYSRSLTRSSRRYGRHMLRVDRFAHPSRLWTSRRFRRVAEVLSMHRGRRPRVRRTLRAWLRSGFHRRLILSRRFRYVGAGKVRGRFGRKRVTTWVVHFAR